MAAERKTRYAPGPAVTLREIGGTRYAAVSRILDEFRARGWKDDDGFATMIVVTAEAEGGSVSIAKLSRVVPKSFLVRNHATKLEVSRLLTSLHR